jgi:hypothetical protein
MTGAELALLHKEAGPEARVLLSVLSGTRVDVGLWFRWRPIRVCACEDRLVLLSHGPRPFVESATYDALDTCFYSHRSAELVLVPAPLLMIRSLAVAPDDGWAFLTLIRKQIQLLREREAKAASAAPLIDLPLLKPTAGQAPAIQRKDHTHA